MGITFNKNESPKLREDFKMVGMEKIRKVVAQCEINGAKSDTCKKAMEELGIRIIEE